ncbi:MULTISPECIES: MFS transporter [Halorussus]|uniref:MFS transporter n=1 Tax=Halorussus TaxID=1070314 RepID=UPI00209F9FFF|nr:MFS transporter [Halorussus vallis]USZ78321.1 MFS transporter [Halorussus vallis]USZ78344.1 MFS transporter [Halorussus vallis]
MSTLPRRAIAVLGTGLFGIGLSVGGYGAYVSLLIDRGVSPDVAGLGMSLFLLGQLVVVLPADRLSRVVPVGRVAAAGLLLGGVGAALGGVTSLPAVLASRSLLGLGQGTAFVASMKHVGRTTTGGDTATAQGLLGALFTLGFAAGLAATPVVLDPFGPTLPAVVAAAAVAVGGASAFRLGSVETRPPPSLGTYLDPFVSPTGLALGLGNMATFGFLMVAATWYADVLERAPAFPATAVLVGFALATVVGRGVGGWLSRRVGERATVEFSLLGLAGLLGAIAAAVVADAPLLLAVALVGTGLGFGVPFGPLFGLAFSELADDAGATLVGMLVVGNLGALVYPWLVGRLLASTASYAAGFGVMAASVAGVWLLWRATVGGRTSVAAATDVR